MLPKVVVKKMKTGEKLAEYFDCVTVFFSTVVEFQVVWKSSKTVRRDDMHAGIVLTVLIGVHFPTLCGTFQVIRSCCSPLEAVAFLNNLYKIMDRRLDQFDVYKVESISDTYLVASGA